MVSESVNYNYMPKPGCDKKNYSAIGYRTYAHVLYYVRIRTEYEMYFFRYGTTGGQFSQGTNQVIVPGTTEENTSKNKKNNCCNK